jgi:hypothetical protein
MRQNRITTYGTENSRPWSLDWNNGNHYSLTPTFQSRSSRIMPISCIIDIHRKSTTKLHKESMPSPSTTSKSSTNQATRTTLMHFPVDQTILREGTTTKALWHYPTHYLCTQSNFHLSMGKYWLPKNTVPDRSPQLQKNIDLSLLTITGLKTAAPSYQITSN